MKQWVRELRLRVWTWWRASEVSPDPAFLQHKALLAKVLWLQDQLDASHKENQELRERLARDDYILGRPSK